MIRKNQILVERNHEIQTLSRGPRQKVRGGKWSARTQKNFYAAKNMKIIFKSNGFLQNVLRDFWFFSKIKLWSKAIIKFKPFREAPDKKLGVENDCLGPKKLFTRPKKWKLILKVMDFCKTFWEISDFWKKSKMAHFLGQFTTRYTWIG